MDDAKATDAEFHPEIPVNLPANREDPKYASDAMVDLLSAMGFDYAFVLPGSSFRGLHDSLVNYGRNHRPQLIMGTHEQIAVSMAHGYAKATGRAGLCVLHDLVGVMNGSIATYNAWCDQSPVVILGGSGPSNPFERRVIDWIHSAGSQSDILKNYVKWTDEPPTARAILESIARANKIALTPPQGPVYVSIDCGVQEEKIDGAIPAPDLGHSRYQPALPTAANPEALDRAVELLVAAEMPLVFAGQIAIRPEAGPPLIELVEALGAAYENDRAVVGMPTAHPQNLSGDSAIRSDADVMLAIDSQDTAALLGSYSSGRSQYLDKGGDATAPKVIDLSLNDMFQNIWSNTDGGLPAVDVQISAEPLFGQGQLVSAVRKRVDGDPAAQKRIDQRKAALGQRHDKLRAAQLEAIKPGWDETPISTARLVHEVYQAVKDKDWLLTVRNNRSFHEVLWEFTGAGQYLGADGGGGVGYGPGAAVGAAIGAQDRSKFCIVILGDGDYVMSASALWSAVDYRVPILAVLNDNSTWGNDELHQVEIARQRARPSENAWIGQRMIGPNIDFATVARGFGAWAEGPVIDPGDLAEILRRAVAEVEKGGVALVDVRTKL